MFSTYLVNIFVPACHLARGVNTQNPESHYGQCYALLKILFMHSYLILSSARSGLITLGDTKTTLTWIFPSSLQSCRKIRRIHTGEDVILELYGFTEALRKDLYDLSFADLESATKTLELVVCWWMLFLNKPAHEDLLWYSAVKPKHLCCRNFLEISLKHTEAKRTHSHSVSCCHRTYHLTGNYDDCCCISKKNLVNFFSF